jgi:hypothetical protein
MSIGNDKDLLFPEGISFLKSIWEHETACELATDERLQNLGVKAPACLAEIGTILSLLDRMASCWWGCKKGDHLVEYLCGRVASTGRAALRLMRIGFYDESLILIRSIDEIANLFMLFEQDSSAFAEWKSASREVRKKKFGPVHVRLRLEKLPITSPINEERYGLLSERATHIHPGTKPQSHNIFGIPVAGAVLQDEGLLVCLNELALALSLATAFGCLGLHLEKEIKARIVKSSQDLAEKIGGATITEIGAYYRQFSDNPAAQKELDRIGNMFKKPQRQSPNQ